MSRLGVRFVIRDHHEDMYVYQDSVYSRANHTEIHSSEPDQKAVLRLLACPTGKGLQGRFSDGLSSRNDRLLLRRQRLAPGSDRGISPLGLGGGGAAAVLVNGLGSLNGVLVGDVLDRMGSIGGVLASNLLELNSLLASNVVTLLELSIDNFLVLNVDEGAKVGDQGRNQSQAPERYELDEEVGGQGCNKGLDARYVSFHFLYNECVADVACQV